jgi:hypothetical protein
MRDHTKLRAFELADKFIEAFGLLAQRGFFSD